MRVTHCKHGHKYTEETTIWRTRKSNGRPFRTCRLCHVTGHRRRNKRYRDTHQDSDRRRADKLRQQFKLTPEKYDQMAADQGYVCAMCKEPETEKRNGKLLRLSVDHCHATNKVRALLCKRCNRLLGIMKDSVLLLERAIEYLKQHGKASL